MDSPACYLQVERVVNKLVLPQEHGDAHDGNNDKPPRKDHVRSCESLPAMPNKNRDMITMLAYRFAANETNHGAPCEKMMAAATYCINVGMCIQLRTTCKCASINTHLRGRHEKHARRFRNCSE